MATIKDVALAAGVSVGTVSNVINGDIGVSDEKTQRVLEAIDSLGYAPNFIARSLRTKVSKTVGLIVPDISNPFYAELARGVEDRLKAFRYTLFLCNKDRSIDKEEGYLDALVEKSVDGIIMVKPSVGKDRLDSLCQKCHVVLIDTDMPASEHYAVVNVDDDESAYAMTRYLYHMGHREIAYFSGYTDARSDRLRFEGYRAFMEEMGLYRQELVIPCKTYRIADGYRCAVTLFEQGRWPSAVFASNDILAFGVMQAAYSKGLRVPEDLSIVGCDDINISSYTNPTLTTIRRSKYQIGHISADILMDALTNGKELGLISMTIPSEQIIRSSVFKHDCNE